MAPLTSPDETARQVVEDVLGEAGSLTTGQLRARLRRRCIEVVPNDARDRYEVSVGERRLAAYPDPEGTATLAGFQLPPDRVTAVNGTCHQQATRPADCRTP